MRARELKRVSAHYAGELFASRPVRARELKLQLRFPPYSVGASRPVRARELKPTVNGNYNRAGAVAPRAGA